MAIYTYRRAHIATRSSAQDASRSRPERGHIPLVPRDIGSMHMIRALLIDVNDHTLVFGTGTATTHRFGASLEYPGTGVEYWTGHTPSSSFSFPLTRPPLDPGRPGEMTCTPAPPVCRHHDPYIVSVVFASRRCNVRNELERACELYFVQAASNAVRNETLPPKWSFLPIRCST